MPCQMVDLPAFRHVDLAFNSFHHCFYWCDENGKSVSNSASITADLLEGLSTAVNAKVFGSSQGEAGD